MKASLFAGIALGMTVALSYNAHAASTEKCSILEETARAIMASRQAGLSISGLHQAMEQKISDANTIHLVKLMINSAYSQPLQASMELKVRATNKFANDIGLICLTN